MNSQHDLFSRLEGFVRQSTPLQQLLNYIPLSAQLEVHVSKAIVCTLEKQDAYWSLVPEPAEKTLGIISFSPEGMEMLIGSQVKTSEELLDLLLKIYLSGDVKFNIKGPLMGFLAEASNDKLHQVLKTLGLQNLNRKNH